MNAIERSFPNLTLEDLVDLLRGELDDADNGVVWGADHYEVVRIVHDRLEFLIGRYR